MSTLFKKIILRNFKKVPYFFNKKSTQLQQNEYALIGQLSTSLLHDVLSPLTSLHIGTQISSNKNDSISKIIHESNIQIKEYVEIMRHFLYQSTTTDLIHVNDEIKKCLVLLKNKALQNNVQIQFLEFDQIKSKIYPIHIYQIIINLITNAIEASEKSEIKKVIILIRKKDNNYIIDCKDYGAGIDKDHLYKIGLIQFSTKSKNRGVGLYSLTHLVSNILKGSIEIESEKDKGTLFTCTLPIIE